MPLRFRKKKGGFSRSSMRPSKSKIKNHLLLNLKSKRDQLNRNDGVPTPEIDTP